MEHEPARQLTRRLDGIAKLVGVPPHPDAVEVLETESDGVHRLVARGTDRVFAVAFELLDQRLAALGVDARY